ncbi:hypothetical protein EWM64_g1288 [Hericium alpestre]|uniref:PUB domain-containing protein n=1 Tax=Hericium alpestre TaxID=135208 RepID=A0A4Z0AAY8_9AGAM|nr:hypothetical protein EWM64_g1288 [Hericium alpestre]
MQNLVMDEEPLDVDAPRSPSPTSSREARLAAIQSRIARQQVDDSAIGISAPSEFQPFDADHEKRQEFRRLIDPGILRANRREQAMASLQTLLTIAENILREPDNPKYKQFKPTNSKIKHDLVDPKGTLEYAVALGFRDEVENFQPFYRFRDRHINDLRIGTAILKEVLQIEVEKQEREERHKQMQKAEEEARKEKVKKAFMDDRKSNLLRDQREKAARARNGTGGGGGSPSLSS